MSLHVVIPHRINHARIVEIENPNPFGNSSTTDSLPHDYDAGFEQGYRAGFLEAQLEIQRLETEMEQESRKFEEEMQKRGERANAFMLEISHMHDKMELLVQEHFPALLHQVLEKLFAKHPFSPQEIIAEIKTVIEELRHARTVSIEVSPSDYQWLEKNCADMNLGMRNLKLVWTTNPDINTGEFFLHSDLGDLDGRRERKRAEYRRILMDMAEQF